MSDNGNELVRTKRLQALGLIPKPPTEEVVAQDEGIVAQDGVVAQDEGLAQEVVPVETVALQPEADKENVPPEASANPSQITLTFNIYPTNPESMVTVVAGLAKLFSELCSVNGSQPSVNGSRPSVNGSRPTVNGSRPPLAALVDDDKPIPNADPDDFPRNDSWLSSPPLDQSTPNQSPNASEIDEVVVIPSEDSMTDADGAYGPTEPAKMPVYSANNDAQPAGTSKTGLSSLFSKPGSSKSSQREVRSIFSSQAGPSRALPSLLSSQARLGGPNQSTGAIRKQSKARDTSSSSESNHSFKADKTGLMSQMAAFFKNHSKGSKQDKKSKETTKQAGAKHFLSDSSVTSEEIMPKKKVRVDPAPAPKENAPDDDPNLGRCPICLFNPKNCKIRCKHLFCEECLKKLKASKKGCPFDGFRFRTWEKLF